MVVLGGWAISDEQGSPVLQRGFWCVHRGLLMHPKGDFDASKGGFCCMYRGLMMYSKWLLMYPTGASDVSKGGVWCVVMCCRYSLCAPHTFANP